MADAALVENLKALRANNPGVEIIFSRNRYQRKLRVVVDLPAKEYDLLIETSCRT